MVTVLQAVEQAKLDYLWVEGVVGIGHVDNVVVFYVETEADRGKVPLEYMGFKTEVKVTGKVYPL